MTQSFDPSLDNSRNFRNALGQFGTGITVVTCQTPTGPMGMTANSFASVSMDPPLVLWSPAKSSIRHDLFMANEHFAIHVIGEEQADVCQAFARDGRAFDRCDWEIGANEVPLLNGCLSRFECTKVAEHDGGDHSIVVARVSRVTMREGAPLLFYCGEYGSFAKPT